MNNPTTLTNDLHAHVLDVLLLHLEHGVPIIGIGNLHVGLGFALLVLQGRIQQQDPRLLDAAAHLGMRHVLVEHEALEDLAVGDLPAGNLLHLGVALDVDLGPVGVGVGRVVVGPPAPRLGIGGEGRSRPRRAGHGQHGLQRHLHHLVVPAAGELGPDAGLDQLGHEVGVAHVDAQGLALQDGQGLLQGAVVALHDDGGVEVVPHERLGQDEHLAGQDDDRRGTVADLLVLGPAQLDHGLGRRLADVDLAEDAVAVVGDDDAAHGIEEHLEHRARTEGGPDDVGYGPGGRDVGQLGPAAGLALRLGVCSRL